MRKGRRTWMAIATAAALLVGNTTVALASVEPGPSPDSSQSTDASQGAAERQAEAAGSAQVDFIAQNQRVGAGDQIVWELTPTLTGPDSSAIVVLPGNADGQAYADSANILEGTIDSDFHGQLELTSVEVTNRSGETSEELNVECTSATDLAGVVGPAGPWGGDCGKQTTAIKVTAANGEDVDGIEVTIRALQSDARDKDVYVAWAAGFSDASGTAAPQSVVPVPVRVGTDTPATVVENEDVTPDGGADGPSTRETINPFPVSIYGWVRIADRLTGTPVPNIKVTLCLETMSPCNWQDQAITNSNGYFKIGHHPSKYHDYFVVYDRDSLDAALEPGWSATPSSLYHQFRAYAGPSALEWELDLIVNGTLKGTNPGGGNTEGPGTGVGNAPQMVVKKGIRNAGGAIENYVLYDEKPTAGQKATITTEITIANQQTAATVNFRDTNVSGGAVQWQKCDKYANYGNGELMGTHTFTTQPSSYQMLNFVGKYTSTSMGYNMKVICTGSLDLAEVAKGNLHKDTVGVIGEGSYQASWTTLASFSAEMVENGTVGGTITDREEGKGIPGVEATLFNSAGEEVSVTATQADGIYKFYNVDPGAGYYVQFRLPVTSEANTEWSWISPVDGKSATFTVARGEQSTVDGVAEKVTATGQISGVVEVDWNDLGDAAPYVPAENVTVELYEGRPTEGNDPVESVQTDAAGKYSFDDLAYGDQYYVKFTAETLPAAPEGTEWHWITGDLATDIDEDGISVGALEVGEDEDRVRINPVVDARARLQETVVPAVPELKVLKGVQDLDTGVVYSNVVYDGDLEGRTETITALIENTGEAPLENLIFADADKSGSLVQWHSCDKRDADQIWEEGVHEFSDPLAAAESLNGVTIAEAEVLRCNGTLDLSDLAVEAHHDQVRIYVGSADDPLWVGDFEASAAAEGSGLEVSKGIVKDGSIESLSYLDYQQEHAITARIVNNTGQALSGITVADTTDEGPAVEGLGDLTNCAWAQGQGALETAESVDCTGTLLMDQFVHQDTVTVQGQSDDGTVYRSFATFNAKSGGSLPRAGMMGMGAYVLIGTAIFGGGLFAVMRLSRSSKPHHTPRHG